MSIYEELNVDRVTTEFLVNEEKRTVVCIITAIDDVPIRLAKYGLADDEYEDYDFDMRVYKGIAKCSPEDEWDETYGRRLAEYRAARARQLDVNADLNKYINGIFKAVDNLHNYGLMKDPHYPGIKYKHE